MTNPLILALLVCLAPPGYGAPDPTAAPEAGIEASTAPLSRPLRAALRPASSEALLRQSALKMAAGDVEASRNLAARAIEADPANASAYFQRASAELGLGSYAETVSDATKAIGLHYEKAAAYAVRSEACAHLGRFSEAFADADHAVGLNPEGAAGYLRRAIARQGLGGGAAEVLADYRRASELDALNKPQYEAARIRLAPQSGPPDKQYAKGGRTWVWGLAGAGCVIGLLYALSYASRAGKAKVVRYGSLMDLPPLSDEPRVGAVVGGRYILGPVAERMGERVAYEGRNLSDEPKTLVRHRTSESVLKAARLLAELRHPNIAAVEGVFEDGPFVYLACEPLSGEPLRRTLDRLPDRRYSPEQCLRLLRALCDALECAHERGLMAGALVPAGIRADKGQVKVWDLGLWPESAAADYAAPERSGLPASRESDLYSLGVCLYEMLTGALPFKGSEAFLDRREGRLSAPSSLAKGLPEGIDAFFSRALDPDPARRFHSASEVFGAFRSLVVPLVQ